MAKSRGTGNHVGMIVNMQELAWLAESVPPPSQTGWPILCVKVKSDLTLCAANEVGQFGHGSECVLPRST